MTPKELADAIVFANIGAMSALSKTAADVFTNSGDAPSPPQSEQV